MKFYINNKWEGMTYEGIFVAITKDWAIWDGDLHSNSVILQHLTCPTINYSNNNANFLHDLNFSLKEQISCVRCGLKVPEYIRKLLLLHNMELKI